METNNNVGGCPTGVGGGPTGRRSMEQFKLGDDLGVEGSKKILESIKAEGRFENVDSFNDFMEENEEFLSKIGVTPGVSQDLSKSMRVIIENEIRGDPYDNAIREALRKTFKEIQKDKGDEGS